MLPLSRVLFCEGILANEQPCDLLTAAVVHLLSLCARLLRLQTLSTVSVFDSLEVAAAVLVVSVMLVEPLTRDVSTTRPFTRKPMVALLDAVNAVGGSTRKVVLCIEALIARDDVCVDVFPRLPREDCRDMPDVEALRATLRVQLDHVSVDYAVGRQLTPISVCDLVGEDIGQAVEQRSHKRLCL